MVPITLHGNADVEPYMYTAARAIILHHMHHMQSNGGGGALDPVTVKIKLVLSSLSLIF